MVRKTTTDVISLLDIGICERQILIELVTVVAQLTNVLPEVTPGFTTEGAHVPDLAKLTNSLGVFDQLFIHETLNVILVRRPQAGLLIPDSVERPTTDHQVCRSLNQEIRVHLIATLAGPLLNLPCVDLKEIHLPSFLYQSSNIYSAHWYRSSL